MVERYSHDTSQLKDVLLGDWEDSGTLTGCGAWAGLLSTAPLFPY